MGLKNQGMTAGELMRLLQQVPPDARLVASYKPANSTKKPITFHAIKFDAQYPRTVEIELQP